MVQKTMEMHYLRVRVDRLTAETSEPILCFVFWTLGGGQSESEEDESLLLLVSVVLLESDSLESGEFIRFQTNEL